MLTIDFYCQSKKVFLRVQLSVTTISLFPDTIISCNNKGNYNKYYVSLFISPNIRIIKHQKPVMSSLLINQTPSKNQIAVPK